MAICSTCKGTGEEILFQYPSPCPTCGGEGRIVEVESSSLQLGVGYDFTTSETFELVRQVSLSPSIHTGEGDPNTECPEAPVGSLYLRGGEYGELWIRSPGGSLPWAQLNSGSEGHGPLNGGLTLSEDRRQTLCALADEWVQVYDQSVNTNSLPEFFISTMMSLPPLSVYHLSQLLSSLEKEALEPQVFVTSCVDFADVRMLDGPQVSREGNRIWVHGLEIMWSKDLPDGYVVAIGETCHQEHPRLGLPTWSYKGALARVTR